MHHRARSTFGFYQRSYALRLVRHSGDNRADVSLKLRYPFPEEFDVGIRFANMGDVDSHKWNVGVYNKKIRFQDGWPIELVHFMEEIVGKGDF